VTKRRRRRSREVALAAVPVLAVAFVGCGGDDDTAYCVDQNDRIVENRYCDDEATNGGSSFFWFYGAGGGHRLGQRVSGGERVAASNIAENARRGGFGSTGSRTGAGGVGRVSVSSGGG
jgi:hypothetical protein